MFRGLHCRIPQRPTFDREERTMPIITVDHDLRDFDAWFEIFSANPPPEIGSWRLIRGIENPNRVRVIGEMTAAEVSDVKDFMDSENMQRVFRQVNEMSTSPIEVEWFDEVTLK